MGPDEHARHVEEALARIARAEERLAALLDALEVVPRAEKTIATDAVRAALNDMGVAHAALQTLMRALG